MKHFFLFILLLISSIVVGQNKEITDELYETYEKYKETSLDKRRIKHHDLQPLIAELQNLPEYTVQKVGASIEGRDLTLISIGTGKVNVFLWSQMHGNEPTATQAIFDIFNFFNSAEFSDEKEAMLSELTIHFLPMLNPDGAEKFKRRNTLGVDINRDALRLQSPESQTLKRIRDSLDADFGFNLHDQSTYYNAELTQKPATISYLAPAFNYDKDINEVRARAMKVIVFMNRIIQKYAPGQVGRYNDDFEVRAFGDNIQKWGTSVMLIESGGYPDDVEKQEIRKLNYVSILSAIYTIANGSYKNIPLDEYETIPKNDRKLFDLKIHDLTYELLGKDYILDLGINLTEIDTEDNTSYYNVGKITDQGDLSTYYAYKTIEANGYQLIQGTVYPKILNTPEDLSKLNIYDLLKSGHTYVRIADLPEELIAIEAPIHVIGIDYDLPDFDLSVGSNATFLLKKDATVAYAVINGFLIDLNKKSNNFKNALKIN